jgi:glucokinase
MGELLEKKGCVLGVDIGGSKITFVLQKGGKFNFLKKLPTPHNRKGLIKLLKENVGQAQKEITLRKVGVSVAGALDKKGEKVLFSPNLRCLNNFSLRKTLEQELKVKVLMENDANCFALSEAVIGAGKNKKSVFGITLGTGVGGGMVIIKNEKLKMKNYEIYKGMFGGAGEIGHTVINFNGPQCTCGNYGCLEEYASERFFERKTGTSPVVLFEKAERGEKKAKDIFKEYGKYLGIGIANAVNLLEPEVVVLGGGIANAHKYFLKTAIKQAKKNIFSPTAKKDLNIKVSKLGDNSAAIGAALLFNL